MKVERTKTKLVISLLALGSTLTFLAFCMAEETDPGLSPDPVVRAEAKPITELPYIINESGSYHLTQNLTHTDRYANAIEIDANNVTIDLGGYSLIGPTSSYNESCSGIYMDMCRNVEIRNGTITNFPNRGIFSEVADVNNPTSGIRIFSVRVTTTGAEGIFLNGLHHTIMNCMVTNTLLEVEQGHGGITCASFSSVIDNVVSRQGIFGIQTLDGCTVRNNTVAECNYGIVPGYGCSIVDNTINFTGDGIWLVEVDGCLVKGNTIRDSIRNGILIDGFDNTIEENLVTACEVGIYFSYNQNVFANNRALYNGVNFDGRVPSGVYDGGGNIGAGTFVGGNVGSQLRLKVQDRAFKKMSKK